MNSFKTFFYSLKRSLFDLKYYKDVKEASFGFSLKYLWFLLFILVFIRVVTMAGAYIYSRPQITPTVNQIVTYAEGFYPKELEFRIKGGQLSTNVKEPYIFELDKNLKGMAERKHFLIIDTQGSIENYPTYNTYVLATRNAVVYPSKSRSGETTQTSVFYFRELKQDFTMNKTTYDGIIEKVKPYASKAVFFVDWFVSMALIAVLVFGSVFWTAGTLFGLLIMTGISWLISLIFKKQYSYQSLYKMGMHAVTWPILLGEVAQYLKFPFPNLFFLVYLVFMIMVMFQGGEKAKAIPAKKTRKPVKKTTKS